MDKISAKTHDIPSSTSGKRPFVALCFIVIFMLGCIIRFQHLQTESVWWDEFATVAFLDPPQAWRLSPHYEHWNQLVDRREVLTLDTFFEQNQCLDPAAMPLYLLLEYAWNQYVHASPFSLRILSLLIGVMLMPLLYFTGKKLFDERAGLIAMACLSMSPIHVQFAKEIRMYGLMTLLALFSAYAFIRAWEEGKKGWWAVTVIATLFLSWTHPFALLLPFVQGLFWLIARPLEIRKLALWSTAISLAVLPAILHVLSIQFWGQDSTDSWMRLPSFNEVINDIFADDAIGATYQINASPLAPAYFLGMKGADTLLAWRWKVGQIFLFVSMTATVIATAFSLRSVFRRIKGLKENDTEAKNLWYGFLALWLVVPPTVLYLLSLAWRPCHQPRYTVPSSLALYLILGGLFTLISSRKLRRILLVLLLIFYGYQQLIMIGEGQHPDWGGAAAHIREQSRDDDLILSYNWLWKRVFCYNLGPVPNPVSYGSDESILADQAAFFMNLALPSETDGQPRDLWIVRIQDYFIQDSWEELDEALEQRGLSFTLEEFRGIQHVLVYHISSGDRAFPDYVPAEDLPEDAAREYADLAMEFWRKKEFEVAVTVAKNAQRINPDYPRSWAYMAMAWKEMGRSEEALAAFEQAISLDPEDYPWNHPNRAELLLAAERHEEALAAAEQGLEILPGDSWVLTLQGQALTALGRFEEAREVLLDALSRNSNDGRIGLALTALERAEAKEQP
jgi:hypothetical protein